MRCKLTSADNLQTYELKSGVTAVVGRAPTSDIPVFDPTISRRHAELVPDDRGVHVRDLGSSNGTFLNGSRIENGTVTVGDTVTFGKVAFKLHPVAAVEPTPGGPKNAPARATIVTQLPVRTGAGNGYAGIK